MSELIFRISFCPIDLIRQKAPTEWAEGHKPYTQLS
jgi:hypothetical protein